MVASSLHEYRRVRQAAEEAEARCLTESAVWLSELAEALAVSLGDDEEAEEEQPAPKRTKDALRCGRLYFQRREYQRCAQKLKEVDDPVARFLRLYALHIDCEAKTKVSLSTDLFVTQSVERPRDPSSVPLPNYRPTANHAAAQPAGAQVLHFPPLDASFTGSHAVLHAADDPEAPPSRRAITAKEMLGDFDSFHASKDNDPFQHYDSYLHYMRAILEHHYLKRTDRAKEHLLFALQKDAYNWAAWTLLAQFLPTNEASNSSLQALNATLMRQCFKIVNGLGTRDYLDAKYLSLIQSLLTKVPTFGTAQLYKADAYYNGRDCVTAAAIYQDVASQDRYRLDFADKYSNSLFVIGGPTNIAHLCALSHHLIEVDRFRPEVCATIANYYTAKDQHEKSLAYWQRTLRLDRNFTTAWILMGHEYVELKNVAAAIESYRRAIDLNQKDYRAWYGLASAYEILRMKKYALYYYHQAAVLRPHDQRIWKALGGCYESLGMYDDAIRCFKQARAAPGVSDEGGAIIWRLAKLYQAKGSTKMAAVLSKIFIDAQKADAGDENNKVAFPLDCSQAAGLVAKYLREEGGKPEEAIKYSEMSRHLSDQGGVTYLRDN